MVVARDAIVINVDGRPIEYGEIEIIDRRTNAKVTIPNQNQVVDEGDEGTPYAFKAHQRVHKSHPAVKACPGAFVDADNFDEDSETINE